MLWRKKKKKLSIKQASEALSVFFLFSEVSRVPMKLRKSKSDVTAQRVLLLVLLLFSLFFFVVVAVKAGEKKKSSSTLQNKIK